MVSPVQNWSDSFPKGTTDATKNSKNLFDEDETINTLDDSTITLDERLEMSNNDDIATTTNNFAEEDEEVRTIDDETSNTSGYSQQKKPPPKTYDQKKRSTIKPEMQSRFTNPLSSFLHSCRLNSGSYLCLKQTDMLQFDKQNRLLLRVLLWSTGLRDLP
jgi:hypothetical protein